MAWILHIPLIFWFIVKEQKILDDLIVFIYIIAIFRAVLVQLSKIY